MNTKPNQTNSNLPKPNLRLNTEKPLIMHLDLNSAFASAEQQAWPNLRNRPIGIVNRLSKECCILTASYEAKDLGVKTGMRRSEALSLCPNLILLESDPSKYTWMYQNLLRIMKDYSPNVTMKSIDEGVLDFHDYQTNLRGRSLEDIGYEIKQRVYKAVGKHMHINVGIGTNRFLAKTASNLHKPNGLDTITHKNLTDIYKALELEDLTGIADAYSARLRAHNIFTPLDFLNADEYLLRHQVFKSIGGTQWYQRLRGFEVDNTPTKLGMIGRQWVLPKPSNDDAYLRSCLHYLAETTGMKLRYRNREARGVCVWVTFNRGGDWQNKKMFKSSFFTNQDLWERLSRLFDQRPKHMQVRAMGLYVYGLSSSSRSQLGLFENINNKHELTKAMDEINDFYGKFTIHSADTLEGTKHITQKIPFGGTEYFELLAL